MITTQQPYTPEVAELSRTIAAERAAAHGIAWRMWRHDRAWLRREATLVEAEAAAETDPIRRAALLDVADGYRVRAEDLVDAD